MQTSRPAQDYEASPEIDLSCVIQALYEQKKVIPSPDLVLHTGQFFRVLSTEYIRLYDGTVKMLEHLRTAGKKIWLLSNAQRIFTQYELRLLGLDQRFDGILISSDYGVGKPDPFFFHQLTEQFGLDFKESLYIGNDAVNDIGGARRAGLDSFYVHSNLSFVTPDWIHASASVSASPSGAFSGAFSGTSSKASLNASPHKKAPDKNASSPLMHFQLGDTVNYTLMDFTGWTI
ncbi:MAG: HAD family hydrolase [Lachnospiraceae bacterium]|nr:HAD family hydrolase [Lachnospiraceae bacterium]